MRFLVTALFFPLMLVLSSCGPLDDTTQATVSITPNIKTDACSANFLRMVPNYCGQVTAPSSSTMISDSTCRSIDLNAVFGVPQSSRIARMAWSATIASANAIAFRQVTSNLYTDNLCTVSAGVSPLIFGAREFAAVAATTIYNVSPLAIFDANLGTNAVIYYHSTLSSCVNCNSGLILYGYYD